MSLLDFSNALKTDTYVYLTRSGTGFVPLTANTYRTLDMVFREGVPDMFVNNNTILIPSDGLYVFSATISFIGNNTEAFRYVEVIDNKINWIIGSGSTFSPATGLYIPVPAFGLRKCVRGDTIQIRVMSTATDNVMDNNLNTFIVSAAKVG